MEKKEFNSACWSTLKPYGFIRRGISFYYDFGSDILLVVTIIKSSYGPSCCLEYGFCFKSINHHMPWPPSNGANVICECVTLNNRSIRYEELSTEDLSTVLSSLTSKMEEAIRIGKEGKLAIKDHYLALVDGKGKGIIVGEETLEYLEIKDWSSYHVFR